MRSQDEIRGRVDRIREGDLFGFKAETLAVYLDFDHAQGLLRDGVTREEWEGGEPPCPLPRDRDALVERIRDYLEFAVEKAAGHRGLSAGRSVQKLEEWVWLLGDDDHQSIDWDDYPQYGAPILAAIIQRLELAGRVAGADDPAFRRMSRGLPCRDGCLEGCGR